MFFFPGEPRRVFQFLLFQVFYFSSFGCFNFSPFSCIFNFHLYQVFPIFTFPWCFHFLSFSGVSFFALSWCFFIALPQVLRITAFFTPRCFSPYSPPLHLPQQRECYQFDRAFFCLRHFLLVAGPATELLKHRPGPSVCLNHKCSAKGISQ